MSDKTDPASAVQIDEEFLNQFPNLVPEVGGLHESIIVGEKRRFETLLMALGDAMAASRASGGSREAIQQAALRALHAYYQKVYDLRSEDLERDVERFIASIKSARILNYDLIERFFPRPYQKQLEMTSDVDAENDPIRLFRLCCTPGDDVLSRRRRFEARRQLTLAQLLFEFRLFGNGPDDLDRDMLRFGDDLKRSYFLDQKSEAYKVVTELSARNAYRVKQHGLTVSKLGPEERLRSTATHREMPIDMRFIRWNGREIPVFFNIRVKRDAVWKLIRKSKRDTTRLDDLCGVKLVFLNEEDQKAGVDLLRGTIAREPGTIFGEASNLARAGRVIDETNLHSAAEYRARKYFCIRYRRVYEIQIELMRDWLNEQFSHGDENHNLYRLRTFRFDLFPRLFPTAFYRLDWEDKRLHKTLTELQLAKIWSKE